MPAPLTPSATTTRKRGRGVDCGTSEQKRNVSSDRDAEMARKPSVDETTPRPPLRALSAPAALLTRLHEKIGHREGHPRLAAQSRGRGLRKAVLLWFRGFRVKAACFFRARRPCQGQRRVRLSAVGEGTGEVSYRGQRGRSLGFRSPSCRLGSKNDPLLFRVPSSQVVVKLYLVRTRAGSRDRSGNPGKEVVTRRRAAPFGPRPPRLSARREPPAPASPPPGR